MAFVICVGGAILLFLRGRNNRSRRLLAGIMLAWGLIYGILHLGVLACLHQYVGSVAFRIQQIGGISFGTVGNSLRIGIHRERDGC